MDDFTQKYLKCIKTAKKDEDIARTINKIYEDGFEDGVNEK
jgi:hypothetical protein